MLKVIGALCIIAGCVGGILWPYTINTWLIFLDKPPVVTFWQGFFLGWVPGIGQLCIAGAFLTWVIMLFIG